MQEIKIWNNQADGWLAVRVLDVESRPGWVQVQQGVAPQWTKLEDVHPADQVALRVESPARQRYQWVPPEDLGNKY